MDKRPNTSFADIEGALAPYMSIVGKKDTTVKRMQPLMERLGNPQRELRIIHIAGTSGKTSTAYYIADLLKASGKRVGLTVSPHVQTINERFQIDLEPVSEEIFCKQMEKFFSLIEELDPQPSYFEILAAFAYWYFAQAGVEYAVIETGVGGLHDASNIAQTEDKTCVITDIGFDHMQLLGESIEEIAAQKAGIIYPYNQVFMYQQSSEIMQVFQQKANDERAILNTLSNTAIPNEFEEVSALPLYQQRNWLLAYKVFRHVAQLDNLSLPAHYKPSVQIPGRMQVRQFRGKNILLDGAHNAQKIGAFVQSFQALYPRKKVPILLALKQGKEFETVLPLLRPICSTLLVTKFMVPAHAPLTFVTPDALMKAARTLGFASVSSFTTPEEALAALLRLPDDTAVVTGSFYLLGNVLEELDKV